MYGSDQQAVPPSQACIESFQTALDQQTTEEGCLDLETEHRHNIHFTEHFQNFLK